MTTPSALPTINPSGIGLVTSGRKYASSGAYGLTVGSMSCSLVGAGIGVTPVVAVAPVVLVGAGAVPSASANAGASANAATRADEAMHTFKFFMWLLRKFLCTIRMTRYTRIFSAFLSGMDYLVSP